MNKRLALIIPCYNEEQRLRTDLIEAFSREHEHIHIWLVNDGSRDRTLSKITDLATHCARVHVFDIPENGGKAEAVRKAMLYICSREEQFDILGFIDADFSAPLEEVLLLLREQELRNAHITAGARVKMMGCQIYRSGLRHYFGRVFATYAVTLLRLPNYDTQCGLKLFNRDIAASIFAEPFFSKWFFDIELFVRAKVGMGEIAYNRCVIEVPLSCWKEVGASRLKLTDFIKAPFEVFRIYLKYRTLISKDRS